MKFNIVMLLALIMIACNSNFNKEIPQGSLETMELKQPIALPTSVLLPIPDRPEDSGAPPEGWCGETSIQMGMAYFNVEIPQKEIYAAGNPAHPELYADDIDLALNTLGVEYVSWDENNHNLAEFIEWIKANLAKGYPVFCGLKLYPTKHPEWLLDHFVLAVGYNGRGLFINTNNIGDGQLLVEYSKLSSLTNKYSFENDKHQYFGRAFRGVRK